LFTQGFKKRGLSTLGLWMLPKPVGQHRLKLGLDVATIHRSYYDLLQLLYQYWSAHFQGVKGVLSGLFK